MNPDEPTDALQTRGQAREILARMRPAFRQHVRPHTRDQIGELLGGGSILSARWDHRLSRDLDVYLHLSTTEDGRKVLDRAAEACGGYRIDHPKFPRIEFERNQDNHIDVSFDPPRPRGSERTTIVDGEPAVVLSTAQIISGKLSGRGMHGPARDLVDVVACGAAEPEALEIAVNALPEKSLDAILSIYAETAKQYAADASELEGIAEGLQPVVDDPAGYASNAIVAAKYERVEIRTRAGAAEIETTTAQGTRMRAYGSAEALQQGMEREGINAFLNAQYRDAGAILDATVDALWTKRTDSILRIEPERLRHERTHLRPIRWRPNRAGGGAGERGTGVALGETVPDPLPGLKPAAGASAASRRNDDR